ncbi:MAG: hypothetical protein EOM21_17730 [Gammaproteobacteria bacterium]|nr:hypothetical protein [Gammaproteobacteria bacterium]
MGEFVDILFAIVRQALKDLLLDTESVRKKSGVVYCQTKSEEWRGVLYHKFVLYRDEIIFDTFNYEGLFLSVVLPHDGTIEGIKEVVTRALS